MAKKTFIYAVVGIFFFAFSAGAEQKKGDTSKPKAPAVGAQTGAGQTPTPAAGKETKPPGPPKEAAVTVSGTAVDVSKKSIKVKDAAGIELEYSITDKTVVKKGTETKMPKDIEKGAQVEISTKGKDAVTIAILPPPAPATAKVSGTIDEINLKKKTLKVKDAAGKVSPFTLGDKTVIKAGDVAKKSEDLKKGDKVEIEAKGDILEMVTLPAPLEISVTVKGRIEDVDVKAKTIKVKDEKGMNFSFDVTEKSEIKMGKDIKKLTDIKKGDNVEVEGKGKMAQAIRFESLSVTTSKEIDEASKEIKSARTAGAESLASEMLDEAIGLLKKAEEEVKKGKLDWAIDDAKAAKKKATEASQMSASVLGALK